MTCNTLPRRIARNWGMAVGIVAVLNILDLLPDWTTLAAVLSLPLVMAMTSRLEPVTGERV